MNDSAVFNIPSLALSNSLYEQRKSFFNQAYAIVKTIYGAMLDISIENINMYIYGDRELEAVRNIEIERFKNLLNVESVSDPERLNPAFASLVTLRMIELDTISIMPLTSRSFIAVHYFLFYDFPRISGVLRCVDLNVREPFLNDVLFKFDSHNKIIDNLKVSCKILYDLVDAKDTLGSDEILSTLAVLSGDFWKSQPFTEGNLLVILYYLIRYTESFDLRVHFNRKSLIKFSSHIREAVILASYPESISYLFAILNYLNDSSDSNPGVIMKKDNRKALNTWMQDVKIKRDEINELKMMQLMEALEKHSKNN